MEAKNIRLQVSKDGQELMVRIPVRIAKEFFGLRAEPKTMYAELTSTEKIVLKGMLRGLQNKEIAWELNRAKRTVAFHATNVLHKLGVRNRKDLLRFFARDQVAQMEKIA